MQNKHMELLYIMKLPYNRTEISQIIISFIFVVIGILTYSDNGSPWGLIFFSFCFIVGLTSPAMRNRAVKNLELYKEYVEFDEVGIKRVLPNDSEEYISWDDIDEIVIATNDQGPFYDDVHWMLINKEKNKGIVISNDAKGFSELLSRFQSLPSFNNEEVINAMGCTQNNWFVVWTNPT